LSSADANVPRAKSNAAKRIANAGVFMNSAQAGPITNTQFFTSNYSPLFLGVNALEIAQMGLLNSTCQSMCRIVSLSINTKAGPLGE
jgi:hypothetical protein